MALSTNARISLTHALKSAAIGDEIADVIDAGGGTLSAAARLRFEFLLGDRVAGDAICDAIDAGTSISAAGQNRLAWLVCDRQVASEIAQALGVVSITTQPDDATVEEGETATFTVVGKNAVSYQWQIADGEEWDDISGATSASYETGVLALADDGSEYRVVVTGAYGTATSDTATLTVTEAG